MKLAHLVKLAHAAEDHGVAQPGALAVGSEAFVDLGGQFASRREDEGSWLDGATTLLVCRRDVEPVQDGQRKGRGLAGAGLCASEQVATGENRRDRLRLDRRRGVVAGVGDRVADRPAEFKGRKVQQRMYLLGPRSKHRVVSGSGFLAQSGWNKFGRSG